jgi:Mg/Co/Ni transporter MgtE
MSPRAAARLEALGFREVYDYAAGKEDWFAFALPRAGSAADVPRVGDILRADVPTCALGDDLTQVRARVRAAGDEFCFVVDESGVVLGRLGRSALVADDDATVEEAMTEGPSTVRPHLRLEQLLERMRQRNLTSYPVTTPDGRLVGVVERAEAERRLTG